MQRKQTLSWCKGCNIEVTAFNETVLSETELWNFKACVIVGFVFYTLLRSPKNSGCILDKW